MQGQVGPVSVMTNSGRADQTWKCEDDSIITSSSSPFLVVLRYSWTLLCVMSPLCMGVGGGGGGLTCRLIDGRLGHSTSEL